MCYDHSTRLLDSLANERKTGVRWHQHNTSAGCIAPRRRLATNYTRGVKHAGLRSEIKLRTVRLAAESAVQSVDQDREAGKQASTPSVP